MTVIGVFKRLECAKLPKFAHENWEDACADVYAAESKYMAPGSTEIIDTGITLAIPPDWEVQVRSRSGLAARGIIVANSPGTIDYSYTGPLKVILHNLTPGYFKVEVGDRIAQLAARQVPKVAYVEIDRKPDGTTRGEGGLGSTGVK